MTFIQGPRAARRFVRGMLAASVAAACMAALAASSLARAADMDKIGLGLPLLTSPFWQSYNIILGSLMVARLAGGEGQN